MADIWVSSKCDVCDKLIKPEEKAILVAEVKITKKETYGTYRSGKGRHAVRVNFFVNSPRSLRHLECGAGTIPGPEGEEEKS